MIVCLLSESAITYDEAVFGLAKAINKDELETNDLLIMGYDIGDYLNPDANNNKKTSQTGSKITAALSGSTGALGKIYAKLKGRSLKELYIGFAGACLLSILLVKWIGRLLTGTFF